MKKAIAISLLLSVILTGCNTVAGVGKDVSKVGDVVTNSAEKTADKL
jgi:predicted small secreted protein